MRKNTQVTNTALIAVMRGCLEGIKADDTVRQRQQRTKQHGTTRTFNFFGPASACKYVHVRPMQDK